jgi:hypothetical protein
LVLISDSRNSFVIIPNETGFVKGN